MDTPGKLVDTPTHGYGESFFEYPKCSVRDLGQSDLCKNLGKFGSLPCSFNGVFAMIKLES